VTNTAKSQLDAFLGDIRENDLKRLVKAVEIDRLSGGRGVPYNSVLDALRPVLRQSGKLGRIPTPQRMFCSAFEDLLQTVPRSSKQNGRISRSSIIPVWEWLAFDLIPDQLADMEDETARAILDGDLEAAEACVSKFQKFAGEQILNSLEAAQHDTGQYSALIELLGSDVVVADLRDIAMCLTATDSIQAVQSAFARPIEKFTRQGERKLKECYQTLRESHKEQPIYILLVVMARMARPWEILPVISPKPKVSSSPIYSDEDRKVVCELLLDDVFNVAGYFNGLRPEKVECAEFVENLNFFLQLSDGVVSSLSIAEYSDQLMRIDKARATVSTELEGIVQNLPSEIMKCLPMQSTGGSTLHDHRVPKLDEAPNEEMAERSINSLRLLVECRFYADLCGFTPIYCETVKEFDAQFDYYKNGLIEQIEKKQGHERENGLRYTQLLTQLAEEYRGPVEADLIRRRAAVVCENEEKFGT
jgi:hypothetical protein